MRERIIIVFIASVVGLLLTTLVFFLYQQTKISLQKGKNYGIEKISSKTPEKTTYLSIETPSDFSLTSKRTVEVKGKTNFDNSLIVSTNQEDVVANPTSDGRFSVSISIDAGVNKIITRAISPSGEEEENVRIITFTTEEF